jgi:hypothetical protein
MKSRQVKHEREKARRRENETERDLGSKGEQHSGERKRERKRHGLILTIGLNQQHLRIS